MSRYLVELCQKHSRHITVEAETEQEALRLAMAGAGDYGDPLAKEVEVVSMRLLEPSGGV